MVRALTIERVASRIDGRGQRKSPSQPLTKWVSTLHNDRHKRIAGADFDSTATDFSPALSYTWSMSLTCPMMDGKPSYDHVICTKRCSHQRRRHFVHSAKATVSRRTVVIKRVTQTALKILISSFHYTCIHAIVQNASRYPDLYW